MDKLEDIGQFIAWWASRLLFTLVLNLCLFGGYKAYELYQSMQPISIDLTQLNSSDKEALASALIDDGYSVPKLGKNK